MKALLIDATKREVREVQFGGLHELQQLVAGYLEVAYSWENGDTLYVNEHGLLDRGKGLIPAFRIPQRTDQALGGNGVLVGREADDESHPHGYINQDPTMTLDELRKLVSFLHVRPLT